MDKAIEKIKWLQDVFVTRKEQQHFDVDVTIKDAFTEALSELQDYKAKIDSLKEWAKAGAIVWLTYKVNVADEYQEKGRARAYKEILEKLEELDK